MRVSRLRSVLRRDRRRLRSRLRQDGSSEGRSTFFGAPRASEGAAEPSLAWCGCAPGSCFFRGADAHMMCAGGGHADGPRPWPVVRSAAWPASLTCRPGPPPAPVRSPVINNICINGFRAEGASKLRTPHLCCRNKNEYPYRMCSTAPRRRPATLALGAQRSGPRCCCCCRHLARRPPARSSGRPLAHALHFARSPQAPALPP